MAKKNDKMQARKCPLCGTVYTAVPALSRADGITLICPDCGTRQALASIGVGSQESEEILGIIHRSVTM